MEGQRDRMMIYKFSPWSTEQGEQEGDSREENKAQQAP